MDWEKYESMKLIEIKDTFAADKPVNNAAGNAGAAAGALPVETQAKIRMEPSGEDTGSIAWRQLFIVNEFNELSFSMRKITIETTLMWFMFFYLVLGWQWIAETNPIWNKKNSPMIPFNDFLKFFLISFIILCITIV